MLVRVSKYYGGFYDSRLIEKIQIDDSLLHDLVVWVFDSAKFSGCAFINLNYATDKQQLKMLINICYELRLNFIYSSSRIKNKFFK